MRQKIFTIEDAFSFGDRKGIVVAGEFEKNSPAFKIGTEVLLIQPEGKEINSIISGITMPKYLNLEARLKALNKVGVWFENLSKEDIPIGTTVFLDESK